MTDTPCVRTFVHSRHQTDQGRCPGVSVLQRTEQLGQLLDTLQAADDRG